MGAVTLSRPRTPCRYFPSPRDSPAVLVPVLPLDCRDGGVRIRLGISWTEADVRFWRNCIGDWNPSSLRRGGCIEDTRRASESCVRRMAGRAGDVVVGRQGNIVNLGFTEQGDLVILVQRRRLSYLLDQACFSEIDK